MRILQRSGCLFRLSIAIGLSILVPVAAAAQAPGQAEAQRSSPALAGSPTVQKKDGPMAASYESGRLPEPLRKPPGSIDEIASVLAKQVSARDERSVPALLTALLTAGFGLRDRDGSVLQTVQPGQGLAFDGWEVAAMAKMYGEGKEQPLAHLSDGLRSMPELKDLQLDAVLVEGIRKHARGDNPLLRFWARFIVELGRQHAIPYDILGTTDPKAIRLDAVQSALIVRRLVGDFYALSQKGNRSATEAQPGLPWRPDTMLASAGTGSQPFLLKAGWTTEPPQPRSDAVGATLVRGVQSGPCGSLGSGDNATILDAAATIITSGWGEMLDLGKLGGSAKKYGTFLNIANIILAYAKFIATYAALETEIEIEDPPLVRTKNSVPGEKRQLTATVRMDTGGWENINCFRTALNVATGLDFSLIKDGSLEGVEVNWHLNQGPDFYSNSTGITGNRPIVGFAAQNSPRIQDAGTYAGVPGKAGTPVGNLARTKTDTAGKARIFLEGAPKIPYVAGKIRTVMKDVGVYTTIKMKGGDIKGDAVDVMSQAIGVILGGAAGLLTMPVELLYRTDWASRGYLIVPVKDHERCNGEWYGTITYTQTFEEERSFQDKNQTNESKRSETYNATIQLTAERLNPLQRVAVNAGSVKANAAGNESRYGKGTSQVLCNLENRMTISGTGNYEGEVNVGIKINPDDSYSLHAVFPSVRFIAEMKKSRKVLECKNPFIKPSSSSGTSPWSVNPAAPDIEGMLDPKHPDVIKGSKTVTFPERYGTKTGTVRWNLTRCGN